MAGPYAQPDNNVPSDMFIRHGDRAATKSDDHGRAPILETDGYLSQEFLRFNFELNTVEPINATVTPRPVLVAPDGTLLMSEADVALRQSFVGFIKDVDTTEFVPKYIGGANGGASFSLTVPAGTNRYLLVFTYHVSTPVQPSAITWNGFSLTKIRDISSSAIVAGVWGCPIGDSLVDETFTLTATGSSASNFHSVQAVAYKNILQTGAGAGDAIADQDAAGVSASSVTSPTLTRFHTHSLYVYGATTGAATCTITKAGTIERQNSASRGRTGEFVSLADETLTASPSSSNNIVVLGVVLKAVPYAVKCFYADIISGFTGLTIGAKYYVQNTAGDIGTSPGTLSMQVGVAISSSSIVIV